MRGEESDGRGREGGGPIKPDGCFVPDCRLAGWPSGWLDRGTMMHITPSIRASERHSAAFPPEARWSGGLGTLDHLDVHDDGRLGRNGSNLLSFPQNAPRLPHSSISMACCICIWDRLLIMLLTALAPSSSISYRLSPAATQPSSLVVTPPVG